MKKNSWIVLMVCLSMVFAGSASAAYMGIKAGYSQVDDTDLNYGSKIGDIDFDSGWVGGIALGTEIDVFRVEAEFEYRNSDGEIRTIWGRGEETLETMSLLLNGYYDFPTDLGFTPYIGAGIGIAEHDMDNLDDDTVFAYQGTIGMTLPISDAMDFDAAYRYFATGDPEFEGVDAEYDSHNITLGLRFKF